MSSALEIVYLTARKDAIFPNIVCVHGYGAEPESTWHHGDTGKTWNKDEDFLDVLGGSCRVFSYGFNAAISANLSPAGILFHAHDLLACLDTAIGNGHIGPTFFVAHSWGGIIVKKALHIAWTHSSFKRIKDCLAGLFFLGTPHVYNDTSIILEAVRNTVALHRQEDDDIPESDIRLYSMAVRRINEIFSQCRPASVFVGSFWESKPTRLNAETELMIISEDCKLADIDDGLDSTVDCSHADLGRFPDPVDPRFEKFISALNLAVAKTMASEQLPVFSDPPKPPPAPLNAGIKSPPSPPPTPPVEEPKLPPAVVEPLFDPKDGPDERIIYWKRKTEEEETHKQRTNFLHSLKGWSEQNSGNHLAVAPGTCSWVLDDPAFTFWRKHPDCATMFITGEAGCGKSHLAKDITNRLKALYTTDTIMNFHCVPGERPALWEYFTWHLVSKDPLWFNCIPARYRTRDVDSPPLNSAAFTEIWNSFRSIASLHTIFLVIDGLEQCGDDVFDDIFASLQQMRLNIVMSPHVQVHTRGDKRPAPTQIKVAFTARSTPATDLASSRLTYTAFLPENVNGDIANYVESRWKPLKDGAGGNIDEHHLNSCKEDILSNAKAYWPYAKFALEQVEKAALQDKIVVLDSKLQMPLALETWLREKIIGKLREPSLHRLTRVVVTFIACWPVDMFLLGLQDMLRVFDSEETEGYDLVKALKKDWADLIRFEAHEKKEVASFIHESIAHVMRDLITEEQRNLNNAFICINYLLLDGFADALSPHLLDHSGPKLIERFLEDNPFYAGAASLILRSIRSSDELALQLLPFLRAFFDRRCPQYHTWCVWVHWKLDRPVVISEFAIPVVLYFVSGGCVNILEHLLPPPGPRAVSPPDRPGVVASFLSNEEVEDFFLDAEDWPETSNDAGQTALMVAIVSRKMELVDFVLQYDPDVNARSEAGMSALIACFMTAISAKDDVSLRLVECLLYRGADVNAFDDIGLTPLCYAAELGNVQAVRLLLSYGANVHVSGYKGETALQQAFASRNAATFAELVDSGADVDTPWSTNETPMFVCLSADSLDMFNIMLPLCDVNRRDRRGLTLLSHSCDLPERHEYIQLLLERPDIDINALEDIPRLGLGPLNSLTRAVSKGNYQAVEMLLQAGADPGRLPTMHTTPLLLAVRQRKADMVKLLLTFNSPVNIYDPRIRPCTPLGVAVKKEDEEIVALLLDHGADPTIEDAYGNWGPLAWAVTAKEPNMRIVRMLLSARISADANALCGKFPLVIEAIEVGKAELVRLLLENGADLTTWLKPCEIASPLVIAAEEGHVEICELLLQHEPQLLDIQFKELQNCETPLLAAAAKGHANVVRFLLQKGARADLLSPVYKESALYFACGSGDIECVELLLEAAPEMVNVPDTIGCMPWRQACNKGDLKIMKALLDAGADFRRKDHFGNGYIDDEFFRSSPRVTRTIELLIQYGLDINEPHDAGDVTVLGLAILDGKKRHVEWLLEQGANPLQCEKPLGKEAVWGNALMLAMNSSDADVFDLLLEPRWGLLEHIGDVDEVGMSVLSRGTSAFGAARRARVIGVLERRGLERGEDMLGPLLQRLDIFGRTPVDLALGHQGIAPSARATVQSLTVDMIEKALDLPAYEHNEHHELVLAIGYTLLRLLEHDVRAIALLSSAIAVPRVGHNAEGRHVEITAFRCCVVCDEAIKEEALACRFCWRLRCGDCKIGTAGGTIHACEMVEVPLVKDEDFDLNQTLRLVRAELQASKPSIQPDKGDDTESSSEESHLQSTLQLATLHAFNLLAIRRPLFTPYLDLAPSVQELISPWKDVISEQRRYWERDNLMLESHWLRREEEIRYLNRGLGRAYVDEADVTSGVILESMREMFDAGGDGGDGGSVDEISD